jgi:hypothetical protein
VQGMPARGRSSSLDFLKTPQALAHGRPEVLRHPRPCVDPHPQLRISRWLRTVGVSDGSLAQPSAEGGEEPRRRAGWVAPQAHCDSARRGFRVIFWRRMEGGGGRLPSATKRKTPGLACVRLRGFHKGGVG